MTDIHPTAIVAEGARLGERAAVGPYCVLGPNVEIGEGTEIMSHVVIDGHTRLGSNCRVFPFASLGTETQDLKYAGEVTQVEIGDGTVIREYVTVNSATSEGQTTLVGKDCFIMAYSHVAHACRIGDGVVMANSTNLAGHVVLEDRCIIGGLVGIHQFVRVGTLCMVGGLARITQDCPPFTLVAGSPATVRGLNSVGLKRNGVDAQACSLLKGAYRTLFREGKAMSAAIREIRDAEQSCAEVQRLVSFLEGSERGVTPGPGDKNRSTEQS